MHALLPAHVHRIGTIMTKSMPHERSDLDGRPTKQSGEGIWLVAHSFILVEVCPQLANGQLDAAGVDAVWKMHAAEAW